MQWFSKVFFNEHWNKYFYIENKEHHEYNKKFVDTLGAFILYRNVA